MTKMRHTSARNWLPFLGFAVIAVFYYFLTWSPELPILGGDILFVEHMDDMEGKPLIWNVGGDTAKRRLYRESG